MKTKAGTGQYFTLSVNNIIIEKKSIYKKQLFPTGIIAGWE